MSSRAASSRDRRASGRWARCRCPAPPCRRTGADGLVADVAHLAERVVLLLIDDGGEEEGILKARAVLRVRRQTQEEPVARVLVAPGERVEHALEAVLDAAVDQGLAVLEVAVKLMPDLLLDALLLLAGVVAWEAALELGPDVEALRHVVDALHQRQVLLRSEEHTSEL